MTNPFSFPRLKFCGFTREEDVRLACDLGVDAIGLNFYPQSPRYVDRGLGRSLSQVVRPRAICVGVFVNATPQEVAETVIECSLDVVQLHGEEPIGWLDQAESYSALREIPILRAISWRESIDRRAASPRRPGATNAPLRQPIEPSDESRAAEWASHENVVGMLVDAHDPVQRGGTGKTARWDLLSPRPAAFGHKPFLLAGGLKVENVEEAIRQTQPDGVDVASGIESAPGIKDSSLMRTMVELVRSHLKVNS
jgi:phosphoribosylanthranilate isomerase